MNSRTEFISFADPEPASGLPSETRISDPDGVGFGDPPTKSYPITSRLIPSGDVAVTSEDCPEQPNAFWT